MYISEVLTKTTTGKVSHRCILLRESYRDAEKVKTRTLANLTHCPPDDIAALRWAFQHPQVFVSADDRARLLERLATDRLDAEDRAVLAQVVQALPPARPAPTGRAPDAPDARALPCARVRRREPPGEAQAGEVPPSPWFWRSPREKRP